MMVMIEDDRGNDGNHESCMLIRVIPPNHDDDDADDVC